MAEEEEKRRRRMMMEEMSKIMKKMSKDMGKLSIDMGKLSKDMGMMSKIMEEMSSTTTTTLPQNLIMEILLWVPAKSLVSSFKFVCKEWGALILDPHFVKMHLNRQRGGAAINGGGGGGGLICKSGNALFQLHPPFNFEGIPPTLAPTNLLADFGSLLRSFRLVGSCNGLVCLSIDHDQSIILLNPSTRKFKISPIQPIEHPLEFYKLGVTYGLGCCYNSTNQVDEYKVVRIASFEGRDNDDEYCIRSQYDIYSMSSDSWRRDSRESGFRYSYVDLFQLGVFSNGSLHWIGFSVGYKGWDRIVSFDIRDEEFREVPIPPHSCEPTADDDPSFQELDVLLMNMRGCLGMIRDVNNTMDGNNTMDVDLRVWVMKEYGMKESWTEEFVIRSSDSNPPRALSEFLIAPSSTAYVLKGDQILMEGTKFLYHGMVSPSEEGYRKLVLYDINEGKIDGNFKMIGVPEDPDMFQVDYIETLVSLKSLLLPMSNN